MASKVEKAQSPSPEKVDKACPSLDDSIKQVNRHTPKKIDPAVAVDLIADATRLKNVMACM